MALVVTTMLWRVKLFLNFISSDPTLVIWAYSYVIITFFVKGSVLHHYHHYKMPFSIPVWGVGWSRSLQCACIFTDSWNSSAVLILSSSRNAAFPATDTGKQMALRFCYLSLLSESKGNERTSLRQKRSGLWGSQQTPPPPNKLNHNTLCSIHALN
jgi:hypothetical protein